MKITVVLSIIALLCLCIPVQSSMAQTENLGNFAEVAHIQSLADTSQKNITLMWSPDDKTIALVQPNSIQFYGIGIEKRRFGQITFDTGVQWAFNANWTKIFQELDDADSLDRATYGLNVWDVLIGKKISEIKLPESKRILQFNADASKVAFVALTSSYLYLIRVFDIRSKTVIDVDPSGDNLDTNSFAFSPNGKLLAASDPYLTVNVYEAKNGSSSADFISGDYFAGDYQNVNSQLSFSHNSATLANIDVFGNLAVWDMNSRSRIWTIQLRSTQLWQSYFAFTDDDKFLILDDANVYGNPAIRIIDARSGQEYQNLHLQKFINNRACSACKLSFTVYKDLLALYGRTELDFWNISNFEPLHTITDSTDIVSASFNHQGDKITFLDANGVIHLWQVPDLTVLQ